MSLSGLENFLNRDSLSQIVIYHGSRGGWIEVAPRSEVKIRQVTLRLIRLLHECVDKLRRTRLMCEVISCDKRGKADFTSVKHFRHFFLNSNMGCCCCCFIFGERRMNGASSWTSPKKGRLFELRQDHYTASINLPVFFKEPGLVSAYSLGVLSWSVVRAKSRWRHSLW